MKLSISCRLILSIIFLNCAFSTSVFHAQDEWDFEADQSKKELKETFNDTRVINGHSVELLDAKVLDLRISHRFGNLAVPASGRTLFGLDNSTDIRIGLEYGINDWLMVGGGRSKGASPYREYWDGLFKIKILSQQTGGFENNKEDNKSVPVSLTLASSAFFTSMLASADSTSQIAFGYNAENKFQSFNRRFSYFTQLILAHNLVNKLSVQVSAGVLHRNFVAFNEQNTNFVIGFMSKIKLYKKISLVGEYYHVFRDNTRYVDPLAISVEIKTYGHVFMLNFINSRGIGEGQFLPYTFSRWKDGAFRFGFTISRNFQL